jgi:hypothetical protein
MRLFGFPRFDSAWLSGADFRRLLPVCCPGRTVRRERGARFVSLLEHSRGSTSDPLPERAWRPPVRPRRLDVQPQLVRIFFNSLDFTVSDRMASFVRTAQLAQRAGATINICSGRLRLWPCGTCGSQERVQRFLRGPCAGGEEELLGVAAFSQLLPQAGRRSFPRPAGDTSSIRCRIPDDVRGLDDTPPDEAGALSNPGV